MSPPIGKEPAAWKTVLGESVVIKGHIQSQEDVTIRGEVEGTIDVVEHQLTIAPSGNVRANVKARELQVLGSIQGKVDALDKVCIRKDARFVGDLRSASLVIEDGAYIKAGIELSRQPQENHEERSPSAEPESPDLARREPIQNLADAVSVP